MKQTLVAILLGACLGCGSSSNQSEPSISEIQQGMKDSFYQETGHRLESVQARKIGKGKWAVTATARRGSETRTLKSTAVMDSRGDIHYYTE